MRKKERASCRHSKYLLNCIQRKMAWIWRGLKTTPPPNMPLWHDYFELEANENQQMQKEPFLDLPFPDYTQKFLRNEDCPESPLLQKFYSHQGAKKSVLRRTWTNKSYPISIPCIFTSPQIAALGNLKRLPLSHQFSTNVFFFVRKLYKPTF